MTDNHVTLYYVPGACSLAVHIALIEAGMPYKLVRVERDKQTEDGRDFMSINPKGYVPALQLRDGTILTENPVILAYIAHETGTLLAKEGLDRWRALESTSFMNSELHSHYKPLFYPDTSEADREKARQNLVRRFATITQLLGDKRYLVGDRMTIADAYLFVMLTWAENFGLAIDASLKRYVIRSREIPCVAQALAEEGLKV